MLKSPEEYLSSLSFDLPDQEAGPPNLDAAERVFVEKYLGADSLDGITVQDPEPVPLAQLAPPAPRLLPVRDPEIVIAPPAPKIEVAPATSAETERGTALVREKITPEIVVAERTQAITIETAEAPSEVIAKAPVAQTVAQKELVEIRARAITDRAVATTAQPIVEQAAEPVVEQIAAEASEALEIAPAQAAAAQVSVTSETLAPVAAVETPADAIRTFTTARDKLKQASHVQVVSFTVADQLFLLPVEGIQEVLRYMELVKVPQAPEYVAGAINLRGTVMPLIHLSALLTNAKTWKYDERSFIIVTGSSSVQMGLIIDKVSSMHMIPQQKIIWNAESKLGDAAEFLCSIVDLDDRVCGMIAPETIAQKLLSEF